MARKPDTPCAGCGKMLWGTQTSLPPGERRCRPCRTAHCGKTRPDICAFCSAPFTSVRNSRTSWTACCSKPCAGKKRIVDEGIPLGGDPARKRAKWRAENHRRRSRKRGSLGAFDHVTATYERELRAAAKQCPLCDIRLIDDPSQHASKELDHMVPLNVGGTHTMGNVRIICRLCNVRRPYDGSDYIGPVTLWACA